MRSSHSSFWATLKERNILVYQFGTQLTEKSVSANAPASTAVVGVIMGSQSDWPTVKPCCDVLEQLQVRFEYGVVSAHRTPKRTSCYAENAQYRDLQVIIACAGGSAHLPGMTASETILPVLGFGPTSKTFGPMDVVGSNIRMPAGIPLGFMGLDEAGAKNAALEAVRILALHDTELRQRLVQYIDNQTKSVPFSAHD